jgi:hypothetical protein
MSKKVIFAHAGLAFWQDVAARLRDVYRWEICYLIGGGQKERALKIFPDSVFHTNAEAKMNIAPPGCEAVKPSALDKSLITALSSNESLFIKMMDRFNYDGKLSYHQRIATYHKQLMYWKGVIEHFNPDLVVFRVAPHMGHDYVLYSLCRKLAVDTLMFERPTIPGLVFPVSSFEEESPVIKKNYLACLQETDSAAITLSPEVSAHLEKLSKPYEKAMPFHESYKQKRYRGGDIGASLGILRRLFREQAKGILFDKWDSDYRKKRYHKRLGEIKRKRLQAHYRQLAKNVDLSVPYIFVALQCEPERQSCPVGGVFTHQYLMIDMLSKLVPEGWKVYVKEHRSQFKKYQSAERSKTDESYDFIAGMPKVELVPLDMTAFELIDHAQATVTVSGTVGWESLVRGKPVLLFGHSWFRACKGVFMTHTVEDCKSAIQAIKNGFQINANEVKCFAQAVEQSSYRGYVDPVYEQMDTISSEENTTNLAKAIYDYFA